MNPNEHIKRCGLCDELKLVSEFPMCGENYLYHTGGFHAICYDCIIAKTDLNNLDNLNKLSQVLDIAFLPDDWIKLSKQYTEPRARLDNYIQIAREKEFATSSWQEQNQRWEKAREFDLVMEEMPALRADIYLFLKKKWGHYDGFDVDDYLKMESYEKYTLNYYNFRDEARRDLVRKMALLSVLIDKKLADGDTKELTSLINSYQSLIKESGIQNTISNDTETITSLSELVLYLEKTGWLMDYKITEDRDIVDATITNMQRYTQRLFSDSAEVVQTAYNSELLQKEAGTEINEEELELMIDSENTSFELEEQDMLSEEELIEMFKGIEKEYANK